MLPPLRVTLIVAADVLYGAKVAASFVAVLTRLLLAHRHLHLHSSSQQQQLGSSVDPVIIVAQKVRSDGPVDLAAAAPDYLVELVHAEAEVRVWRLRYKH